jgi:methyltransferase (TIGR00027 family)
MTNAFAQQEQEPSRTALAAAAHRAAHQLHDGAAVFRDPLALAILGEDAQTAVAALGDEPRSSRMRRFIAARTRLAEEALHAAIEKGCRQLVVLGAGLDTYAYRGAQRDALASIFEVDHPGTQAWKRKRLAQAGIAIPSNLKFVPVNFEKERLADALRAAGFDEKAPSFFTWLGVVPYLTGDAVRSTLSYIAGLARSHVVFDYAEPPELLDPSYRAMHEHHAQRVAAAGESWNTFFDPPRLHEMLRSLGFATIHDLGPRGIAAHFYPDAMARAPERGGHVLHAASSSSSSC